MSVTVPVAIPLKPTNHTTLGRSHPAFAAISKDGVTLSYIGKANHTHDAGAARTIAAIPANHHMAYFEAKVVSSGTMGNVHIGFISKDSPLNRNVGTTPNSYGYSGNNGRFHIHGKEHNSAPKGTPTFSTGDTVGCGVHYEERFVFFTKNGSLVGTVDLEMPEPERFTHALGQNATIEPNGYTVMQDLEMLDDPFLERQDDTAHDAEHVKTKMSGGGTKQTSMTNRQIGNAGVFSSECINQAKTTSSNVPFMNEQEEIENTNVVFDAGKHKVDAVKDEVEIPLLCRHDRATELYPAVSVHSPGECIRVVFNPSRFLFQLQVFSEEIKDRIGKQILETGDSFEPLQEIVHNYLRINGYQKTLRVLNRNQNVQSEAASSHKEQDLLGVTTKHDVTKSVSMVSEDNMDDNLGSRASLRRLIISNKLKEAQILIQEEFLAYYKHEKIQYLFRVLEYINIVRKSYPKTKVEYFRRKKIIHERNKSRTKPARTGGQSDSDTDHEKLMLLHEHVKMLNKSMMENLNLKTNYHLDPATLSILNAADDGAENNIEEENKEINIFKLLGMDTDKYCLGDDYLYDKYIVEATGFAKKHFRSSDCLATPLMGLLTTPDYDYLMNRRYRVEVADEINGILINLEYCSDAEAMTNKAPCGSTQTTRRKDYHFRLDEMELKRRKEEIKQDMDDVFGPALPPEMYIDRYESLLHEHMSDNAKKYVVDVPTTELRSIVEHTIAAKSIIDTI